MASCPLDATGLRSGDGQPPSSLRGPGGRLAGAAEGQLRLLGPVRAVRLLRLRRNSASGVSWGGLSPFVVRTLVGSEGPSPVLRDVACCRLCVCRGHVYARGRLKINVKIHPPCVAGRAV